MNQKIEHPTRLLWLDMEMTGLDPEREAPIEIAAIVTDFSWREKETFHAVIHQPKDILDRMDDWNRKHHGESGLIAAVAMGEPIANVEKNLIRLIDRHFLGERPILAGNSIFQDRLFIRRHFPNLENKLHYRMLDVSSLKVLMLGLYQQKYEKKNSHRALDDIRESIAELRFYLGRIPELSQG